MKKAPLQSAKFMLTVLTLSLVISCSPYKKRDFTGTELPAYESADQHRALRHMLNQTDTGTYQQLLVNGTEYELRKLQKILDTLPPNYTMEVRLDSISNKQLLILKTQP